MCDFKKLKKIDELIAICVGMSEDDLNGKFILCFLPDIPENSRESKLFFIRITPSIKVYRPTVPPKNANIHFIPSSQR